MHQLFHVLALSGFMVAGALAFVGLVSPLLFPEGGGFRLVALRSALILALLAIFGLLLDRGLHAILGV
jgi:hypothetical protein